LFQIPPGIIIATVETKALIDCHLHLQESCFAADLPAVLERARSAGVRLFVCNGSSRPDWPGVLNMARSNPSIVPCFGIHPFYTMTHTLDLLDELRQFLAGVPSAVGETGLDRYIEPRNEQAQEGLFRAQLTLAAELDRPITIHCVGAWGPMMDILRTHRPLPDRMLFHSYGGSVELIKPLAEMGAYFSYSGNMLREKAARKRQALTATPIDRLLLETDSPYMPPPKRYWLGSDGVTTEGKPRNEPVNLAGIARGAAELLNIPYDELCARLFENTRNLFRDLIPADL
jgi:TatD DNase family protein